ncbi:hypothetical protein RB595_007606 [Gaeumannomyces hyphopodioides]
MAPQSLKAFLAYAGNLFAQLPASLNEIPNPFSVGLEPTGRSGQCYIPLSGAPACPVDGPLSCHNSTPVAGDCCFIHPGGRMLLTQFWDDQVHAGGADEDWTLHGLWPDLCDGGFDQFCNLVPQYKNISAILKAQGQSELVEFMDRYWLSNRGSNEGLWEHEWNKHGTCINTLAASCYSPAAASGTVAAAANPGELAVVDYFTRAVALFKSLDTFTALQKAGITPSSRTHYPLVDVQAALERHVGGGKVVLRCAGGRRGTILREAWYHFFVQGSLQSGEFVPAKDPPSHDAGNCAPWVRYMPKRGRREL